MRQPYASVTPYVTKDGSEIRELMHPTVQGNKNQRPCQATIPVGGKTPRHKHLITEELYHITQGHRLMHLGDQNFEVFVGGDYPICIKPGTEHCIENIGTEALVLLCSCSSPYAHGDTVLVA